MGQKTVYQYFKRTIAANGRETISVYGKFLTMLSSDGTEYIRVSIGGEPEQELPEGLSVDLLDEGTFKKLVFRNNEGAAVEIEFAISFGKIHDSRLTISGSVFDNLLAELQGDSVPEGYGNVNLPAAATLVLAANTDRKSCIIQAYPANADNIVLGFNNTVSLANYFVELAPGEAWSSDDYRGDIYAFPRAAGDDASYGEV